MAVFGRRLRHLAARATFVAVAAFGLVPSAGAQWAPPFGAAPPGEIVQRLRAEGYVLIGPLRRRDTVYLADVAGGPAGRERLVLDAWSGEILQRFVARRVPGRFGGYVPEGGEFNEPPPLGPPPARDFREGNYGYEPGARPAESKRRRRPSGGQGPPPRPAKAGSPNRRRRSRRPPEMAIATPPRQRLRQRAAPRLRPPLRQLPLSASSSSAAAQAKEAAPPAAPARANPAPASAEKPGEKKVNDLPVNPLD